MKIKTALTMIILTIFTLLGNIILASAETNTYISEASNDFRFITKDFKDIHNNKIGQMKYVVRFNYGLEEYVMDGGSTDSLDGIMDILKLPGDIQEIEISNYDLLDVYKENNEWYIISKQPFVTEEWMKIKISGVEYIITITDDQVTVNSGREIREIPGVVQGSGDDFAATIPIADIWIDESKINRTVESRNLASFTPGPVMSDHPGFVLYDTKEESGTGHSGYMGRYFLEFNTSIESLTGTVTTTRKSDGAEVQQSYNYFDGIIGTFKWDSAAVRLGEDGEEEYLDVYVEYSDLTITFPSTATNVFNNHILGLFAANAITIGGTAADGSTIPNRYAISVNVKPYIKDKNGDLVNGNFYYPMVDLDVLRTAANFKKFYKGDPTLNNYDDNLHYYSETAIIGRGIVDNNGHKIYIPGGDGDSNYKSQILYDTETKKYSIYPGSNEGERSDDNTFYSGFITLVKNGEFSLEFLGSSGVGQRGMETNILSGTPFNHKLKHSTGPGGTILTTRAGNHNGELNDGYTTEEDITNNVEIINPTIIATATGQTVTYTFKPNPGYKLKEVWVQNGNIDYRSGNKISSDAYKSYDDDGDGVIDRYTYTFTGINSDNAIHVEWVAPKLKITKNTTGNDVVSDTFTFQIKAWKESDFIDFSSIGFTDMGSGVYQFTLTNNQTFELPEALIPIGYNWEVNEVGLGTQGGWTAIGGTTKSGIMTEDNLDQSAVFINQRGVNNPIIVQKEWEDDIPEIRPETLKIYLSRKTSTLQPGNTLNSTMMTLAGSKSNITALKKATKEQYEAASSKETISSEGMPTYMWYEAGTIYYYSEAETIYLNPNSKQLLDGMLNITDISGLANVNTTYVTNMFKMFQDCRKLTDISPLENWDTGNVTSMRFMFASSVLPANRMQLSNIGPLQNWNTGNVTDMGSMFKGANITDVSPISGWNVSNVANMQDMFFRATVTDASSLSGWNVIRVGNQYINEGNNGNIATGTFNQMFKNNGNGGMGSVTVTTNLPQFTARPGSWDANATYNTSGTGFPVAEQTIIAKTKGPDEYTKTVPAIKNGNTWTYEFEIPYDDGSKWRVYEDVPDAYTVSDGTTDGVGSSLNNAIKNIKVGDTVTLHNTRKTKEVVLKKIWIDDDNSRGLRPNDLSGSITYTISTINKTLVTKTENWVKNGSSWEQTFKIPEGATISDWNEQIPIGYKLESKTSDEDIYTLTNSLEKFELTITKKVTGNMAELNKEFDFTINIKNRSGDTISESFPSQKNSDAISSVDASGAITVKLKHGDTFTISDIPYGYTYEVVENKDGYKAYNEVINSDNKTSIRTLQEAVTATGSLTTNHTVKYTNNKEASVLTGLFMNKLSFILLLIVSLVATVIIKKWYNYRKDNIRKGLI